MAKKSAVAEVVVIAAKERPVFVEREVAAPVRKGQNVYKYGGTEKAAGVPLVAQIEYVTSAALNYKPRTAEAECWVWFCEQAFEEMTVAEVKEAAKEAGFGHAIAGMMRHAARRGAIKIAI
jgi:hypothetical protein